MVVGEYFDPRGNPPHGDAVVPLLDEQLAGRIEDFTPEGGSVTLAALSGAHDVTSLSI